MNINLHLLRIFYMVTERNSFSLAAKALFISQPAVSKGVRELEHQLSLPLIERSLRGSNGICLTDNGKAIREHARGIFALERAAIEEIEARVNRKQGRLIIGASTTIAGYHLPPCIAKFIQHHPLVEIKVIVGNTHHISQLLIDCEVDLALVEGAVDNQRIISQKWQGDPLSIVAPKDASIAQQKKLTKSTLSNQIWLMREQGSGTRAVMEKLLFESEIIPKKTIEIGSNEGIARTVVGGMGIALLPTIMVKELIELQQISVLTFGNTERCARPLSLIRMSERPLSPLAQQFTLFIKPKGTASLV